MADLIFVSIIVAFTALCIGYIAWCDHIIGPDAPDPGTAADDLPAQDAVTL